MKTTYTFYIKTKNGTKLYPRKFDFSTGAMPPDIIFTDIKDEAMTWKEKWCAEDFANEYFNSAVEEIKKE